MPTTFAAYIGKGHAFDRVTRLVSRRIDDLPISSHLELLMPPLPCRAATTISASKRDGCQVRIKKRLEFKPGHWRFWTFWGMDNVEAWALACEFEGFPYDLRGAVMSVTPFARSGTNEIFCSEFMGLIADMHKPHTLTPSDWEANAKRDGAEMTVLTENDGGAK